jgi:hypothetical protein
VTSLLTKAPGVDAARLERLEAEFLRSPGVAWPLPPEAGSMAVELPAPLVPDDDDEPEHGLTMIRTSRGCCR